MSHRGESQGWASSRNGAGVIFCMGVPSDSFPRREVCEVARRYRLPILLDVVRRLAAVEMLAPQYPDLNFIIPHLGGTLTLFLQRMDNVARRQGWRERHSSELMPSDLARRFWFDTVNEQHSALRCACETFGVERIMLGTDWPMLAPEMLKHFVDYVSEALPAQDAEAILERNAAALLGIT